MGVFYGATAASFFVGLAQEMNILTFKVFFFHNIME